MNLVTQTTVKCDCGCLFDVDRTNCPSCRDTNLFSKRRCPNCDDLFDINADTCPRCNTRKFYDSVSCFQCGVFFPGHLKRCTRCNQVNTEKFKMCDDCHLIFSSQLDSCPTCKVKGNGFATCENCGSDFDKHKPRCPRCGLIQQANNPSGYIYMLINPAMQGHLKIGMTNRTPQERADELSSTTGIPSRFLVAYSVQVQNPERIELLLHAKLAAFRLNNDREFFIVTLEKAIETLMGVLRSCREQDGSKST